MVCFNRYPSESSLFNMWYVILDISIVLKFYTVGSRIVIALESGHIIFDLIDKIAT